MKKVLSMFIVAALVFALLPLSAFAADTDFAGTGSPINRVDVTGVIAPVPGNTPAYDVSIPEDANYTLVSVDWYTTDQAYIAPGTVFEAGKDYMIGVEVAPKDGYEFPETVTGTVNGRGDNVQMWGGALAIDNVRVMGTFQCRTTNIYSIPVTDLKIPAAGEKPSYTATIPSDKGYVFSDESESYIKNGIAWFDDEKQPMDPDTAVFETGRYYTVKMYLKTTADDQNDYTFSDAVVPKINDDFARIEQIDNHTHIVFSCSYFCNEIISVEVNDIVPPAAGDSPAYTSSVPQDAGYMVRNKNNKGYQHGVCWYDAADNSVLSPTDVFEPGKDYKVCVFVDVVSEDLVLADGYHASVNGQDASVEELEKDKSILVEMTFTCSGKKYILGDADADGKVTSVDATLIQRKIALMVIPEGFDETAADVDGDKRLSALDATLIQRYLTQIDTNYEIGKEIWMKEV